MPKDDKGKISQPKADHPYGGSFGQRPAVPKVEPPNMEMLLSWLKEQGVWISDKIELKEMQDGTGWAIFAVEDCDEPQIVGKIPRSAILSVNTSKFGQLVPKSALKFIPSIIHLSLVLLFEFRLGNASKWNGYLQSLPRGLVSLAALWDVYSEFGDDGAEGLEWLKGTEVEKERKRVKKEGHTRADLSGWLSNLSEYFPLTPSHPTPPSLNDLLHAYSLVSSRVFQVDRYHQMALVPFADLFNHREENDVHFESDDYVCDECGSLPACSHDELVPSSGPTSPLIPVRLAHLPLPLIEHMSNPEAQTLDMALIAPLAAGSEVFNTYGENISAAKMLLEWGFIDESEEVEGPKLFWTADGLLEDEEWRDIWKKLAKKRLKDGYQHADDDEIEDDKLLFDPPQDGNNPISAKDSLFVNSDGQTSITMFQAVAIEELQSEESLFVASASGTMPVESILKLCEQLVELVWQRFQELEGDDLQDALEELREEFEKDYFEYSKRICGGMLELFSKRTADTKDPSRSVVELLDAADALSKTKPLSRMAMLLMVDERRMIEVAASRWKSVTDTLSAVVS